jgi:hypothetical protein
MKRELIEVILTGLGLGGAYAILHHSTLFKERTLDEVVGYLRKLDWEEVSKLFDTHEEEKLMGFWTRREFRRTQRARLDLASEFLERMYHDNRIFFQWGSTEYKDMRRHHLQYEPETLKNIRQLVRATKEFRRIALIVIFKVKFLSLLNFEKLRFLPVPSVAALRTVWNGDLLQAYEAVVKAAAAMASVYGEEYGQEIMAII